MSAWGKPGHLRLRGCLAHFILVSLVCTAYLAASLHAQNVYPLPEGQAGSEYPAQKLNVAGGIPPLHWQLVSEALPEGLRLTSDGVIEGTPTKPGVKPYDFAIQVSDSSAPAETLTIHFSLAIRPAALRFLGATGKRAGLQFAGAEPISEKAGKLQANPEKTSPPSPQHSGEPGGANAGAGSNTLSSEPALTITTKRLPDGTVGQPYNETLQATGGTKPYTWSVTSGTLPAGLSLNSSTGGITGTPSGPEGTADLTFQVAGSGSSQQLATSLSITLEYRYSAEVEAGGSITDRAVLGTDVSAASSLPTQQRLFLEFNIDAPLPFLPAPWKTLSQICVSDQTGHRVVVHKAFGTAACPAGANQPEYQDPLSSAVYGWLNTRIEGVPQQGGLPLTAANVQTSSAFINSVASTQLNKIVQGLEFLGGLEFRLAGPRRGVPFPFPYGHARNSLSFVVGLGGTSPFSTPAGGQQEFVATQAFLNQEHITTPLCTATMTSNCVKDVLLTSPDRTRFFRQYYAGLRFKTYYFLSPGESPDWANKCGATSPWPPNDICKTFPGVFDFLVGQDEEVTGGRLRGSVLRFEAFYPIPAVRWIYVYGTALVALTHHAVVGPPLLIDPESSPLPVSDPRVVGVTFDTSNRDFFRLGVGFDLIHVVQELKGKNPPTGQGAGTATASPARKGTSSAAVNP